MLTPSSSSASHSPSAGGNNNNGSFRSSTGPSTPKVGFDLTDMESWKKFIEPVVAMKKHKWEAHRGLMLTIPSILTYLRDEAANDPMLFLRRDHQTELSGGDALRLFFESMDRNHEISYERTHELCRLKNVHALATLVRTLLQHSKEPLIPADVCFKLLHRSPDLTSRHVDRTRRLDIVKDMLEKLATWRFELFGTLCGFLRDCKTPNADLARDLGPCWLLPPGVSLSDVPKLKDALQYALRMEEAHTKDTMAAGDVMRFLIDESVALFGSCALGDVTLNGAQRAGDDVMEGETSTPMVMMRTTRSPVGVMSKTSSSPSPPRKRNDVSDRHAGTLLMATTRAEAAVSGGNDTRTTRAFFPETPEAAHNSDMQQQFDSLVAKMAVLEAEIARLQQERGGKVQPPSSVPPPKRKMDDMIAQESKNEGNDNVGGTRDVSLEDNASERNSSSSTRKSILSRLSFTSSKPAPTPQITEEIIAPVVVVVEKVEPPPPPVVPQPTVKVPSEPKLVEPPPPPPAPVPIVVEKVEPPPPPVAPQPITTTNTANIPPVIKPRGNYTSNTLLASSVMTPLIATSTEQVQQRVIPTMKLITAPPSPPKPTTPSPDATITGPNSLTVMTPLIATTTEQVKQRVIPTIKVVTAPPSPPKPVVPPRPDMNVTASSNSNEALSNKAAMPSSAKDVVADIDTIHSSMRRRREVKVGTDVAAATTSTANSAPVVTPPKHPLEGKKPMDRPQPPPVSAKFEANKPPPPTGPSPSEKRAIARSVSMGAAVATSSSSPTDAAPVPIKVHTPQPPSGPSPSERRAAIERSVSLGATATAAKHGGIDRSVSFGDSSRDPDIPIPMPLSPSSNLPIVSKTGKLVIVDATMGGSRPAPRPAGPAPSERRAAVNGTVPPPPPPPPPPEKNKLADSTQQPPPPPPPPAKPKSITIQRSKSMGVTSTSTSTTPVVPPQPLPKETSAKIDKLTKLLEPPPGLGGNTAIRRASSKAIIVPPPSPPESVPPALAIARRGHEAKVEGDWRTVFSDEHGIDFWWNEMTKEAKWLLPSEEHDRQTIHPGYRNEVSKIKDYKKAQEDQYAEFEALVAMQGGQAPPSPPSPPPPPLVERVRCKFPFTPSNPIVNTHEMALQQGDVMVVVEKGTDGWWEGVKEKDGKKGLFPAVYVELLERSSAAF